MNRQGPCQGTETKEGSKHRENPALTSYSAHHLLGHSSCGPETPCTLGSAPWFSVLKKKKKERKTDTDRRVSRARGERDRHTHVPPQTTIPLGHRDPSHAGPSISQPPRPEAL